MDDFYFKDYIDNYRGFDGPGMPGTLIDDPFGVSSLQLGPGSFPQPPPLPKSKSVPDDELTAWAAYPERVVNHLDGLVS